MATGGTGNWTWRIARTTLVAALLVVLAGPLMAWGLIGWQAGLGLFVMAALLAGLGAVFCLYSLFRRRGSLGVALAAAAGIAAAVVPIAVVANARAYPPINDITTDPANPPAFAAITSQMRGPDAAPLLYDRRFAAIQAKGYPALAGVVLPAAPATVFDKALVTAKLVGWTIIASDAGAGRIEATATLPWWGFKDDIVVRLTPEGEGTRVDLRSKSRVGQGDLGVNAKRINDFLHRLQA
jgi:hypothetical protein